MAGDETRRPPDGRPTQGGGRRGQRRSPPTIEGEAVEMTGETAADQAGVPAEDASPASGDVPRSPFPSESNDDAASVGLDVAKPATEPFAIVDAEPLSEPKVASDLFPTETARAVNTAHAPDNAALESGAPGADPVFNSTSDRFDADPEEAQPPLTGVSAETPVASPLDTPSSSTEPAFAGAAPSFADASRRNEADAGGSPPWSPAPATAGGGWSRLPAALGVLSLLLLAVIAYLLFAGNGSSATDALAKQVDDLKAQVATLDTKVGGLQVPDGAAINKRLTALDDQTGGLKTTLAALQARVDKLGTATPAVGAAATTVAAPDLTPRFAALDGKTADLATQVTALRTALSNLPKPDFGPVNARVADLDKRLADLSDTVKAIPRVDLAPVNSRIDDLATKIGDLGTRLKPIEAEYLAAKNPQRVTDARREGSAAETRAAPLAVTAQTVLRAVEAGRPFPEDFKALQLLGVSPTTLAPLQPLAATGGPTIADLRGDLAGVRDAILAGSAQPASGSYFDRIVAGASGLVQVRPLGSVVGDSPAAILSRIDADLTADDLSGALAEWQKLPEKARTASKAFAERTEARRAAEAAAKSIAADAITAIAAAQQ